MNNLRESYFSWLRGFIYDPNYRKKRPYSKLLRHLDEVDFFYILEMDSNRYQDGVDMRGQFLRLKPELLRQYSFDEIEDQLDDRPCSVFEMMVALAIRCEKTIMVDELMGDRTAKWFWEMIDSLGLIDMDDSNYDDSFVDNVLSIFMNRLYDFNGHGGLFTIKDTAYDLSTVEIWYQANWYLSDLLHI